MAMVTLRECWLHDAGDYADYLRLAFAELQVDDEWTTHLDERADGSVVARWSPARHRTAQFVAHTVDAAALAKLRGWATTRLMLRTPPGDVFFGVLEGLPVTMRPDGLHQVEVVLRQVAGSVEV